MITIEYIAPGLTVVRGPGSFNLIKAAGGRPTKHRATRSWATQTKTVRLVIELAKAHGMTVHEVRRPESVLVVPDPQEPLAQEVLW